MRPIQPSTYPRPITPASNEPLPQPEPNLGQLRSDYLTHFRHSYHALDFKGIPYLSTLTSVLALEDVCVPLLPGPSCLRVKPGNVTAWRDAT